MAGRAFSLDTVKGILKRAWPFYPYLEVAELVVNVFLCEFNTPKARENVLHIKGYMLPLQAWPPSLAWQELVLDHFPIWVQIHGLPLEKSNGMTAKFIGEALSQVLEIDDREDKKIWCGVDPDSSLAGHQGATSPGLQASSW